VTVAVVGEGRAAVETLIAALRGSLEARDAGRLRSLFAPTIGGVQQPGPGMSREAWLAQSEAIFAGASRGRAWLQEHPTTVSFAACAPRCPSALLAPGQWLVRWPAGAGARVLPGLPSDRLLPSTLRVAVADGVAVVVGVDDDIATARGPATVRASGWLRP
jgi:hypothetical protein